MAKRAELQSVGLMSADYKMSAPLVVGEDIFMEEMDNDSESEWSLEIKWKSQQSHDIFDTNIFTMELNRGYELYSRGLLQTLCMFWRITRVHSNICSCVKYVTVITLSPNIGPLLSLQVKPLFRSLLYTFKNVSMNCTLYLNVMLAIQILIEKKCSNLKHDQ